MTRNDCIDPLVRAGISDEDAHALRRIAMTLHRWHELECGDSDEHSSWCVSRGRKVSARSGTFEYDDAGAPYLERHPHDGGKTLYTRLGDRETGAKKRLAAIMAKYPTLGFYIQGDPRGAALYILRPGDVPAGEDSGAYYSRGLAVYK